MADQYESAEVNFYAESIDEAVLSLITKGICKSREDSELLLKIGVVGTLGRMPNASIDLIQPYIGFAVSAARELRKKFEVPQPSQLETRSLGWTDCLDDIDSGLLGLQALVPSQN
jgi:hypothetical protein